MPLNKHSRQSGNVLFLILIAVALFAALAYAITSSNRGGKTGTASETGELGAGRILNFTTAVQAAVLRLSTIKGVPVPELKYNNDVSTAFDNVTYLLGTMGTPSDPSLYVFHPQGGGVPAQKFEDLVTPCSGCGTGALKSGHFGIHWLLMPGNGTSEPDAAFLIADLRDDACLAINKKLGIDFIPNITFGGGPWIYSSATPPAGLTPSTGSTTADFNAIDGKSAYCFKKINSPVRNVFLSVLKAY